MITTATEQELDQALSLINKRYDNNILIGKNVRISSKRVRFTLRTVSSKAPGHSRTASGKRMPCACWHVHGEFFDVLFQIRPDIFVISGSMHHVDTVRTPITKLEGNWIDYSVGRSVDRVHNTFSDVMASKACDCGPDLARLARRQMTGTI